MRKGAKNVATILPPLNPASPHLSNGLSAVGEAQPPRAGQAPRAGSRIPLAAKGFRPFFLLAGTFATLLLPLWLLSLVGIFHPEGYFNPTYWHAHEMVFGFASAVIAGFLLTAVGNWTSRETLVGVPLLLLGLLWLLARVALITASIWPLWLPAVIDLSFLPALAIGLARPIVASRKWQQLPIVALLGALFTANLSMHMDVLGFLPDWQRRGSLVAVDVVILFILVIAGRVFPMFTRNGTGVKTIRSIPMLDALAIAAMLAVTVLEAVEGAPDSMGYVAGVASLLCAARAWHWGARHTLRVPLLWILHVGYAWIPIGLALRAFAAFEGRVPPVLGTHALTVGAIGCLTLGMMSRVGLGHSGRPMVAPKAIVGAFALITMAALVRVFVPLLTVSFYALSVDVAGTFFACAFLIFSVVYFPVLTSPRVDGKPG
jgi:uncharacterized protein involved in response to NO